ncbi:hypothetical protein KY389_10165 [Paracoccus bogoriensis]|nr:hypothetical protein [Paracoccus bogoriensis]
MVVSVAMIHAMSLVVPVVVADNVHQRETRHGHDEVHTEGRGPPVMVEPHRKYRDALGGLVDQEAIIAKGKNGKGSIAVMPSPVR